jgi:hypothetical protein
MTMVSVSELVKLTEVTPATVRKRCNNVPQEIKKGSTNIVLFNSKRALMAIFEVGGEGGTTLEEEKIKLTSAQAEKVGLEVDVLKGVLVPADEIEEHLNRVFGSFKARLLSIPTKAAPSIIGVMEVIEIEEIIKDYMHEALSELKNYEPANRNGEDINKIRLDARTTAEADSKPVGGQQKKTKSGSKRRKRPVEH